MEREQNQVQGRQVGRHADPLIAVSSSFRDEEAPALPGAFAFCRQ
jgi:hypothetical protein